MSDDKLQFGENGLETLAPHYDLQPPSLTSCVAKDLY